jgi:hypothetical protein
MTPEPPKRVQVSDGADEPGRTTATLIASLAARLAVLHLISGADAIGSLTAGFAVLGREISRTAKGARLRKAIEAGRPSVNGNAIWKSLRIGEWASSMPPSPVLDQLRNDVALLLAGDLGDTLEFMPVPDQGFITQRTVEPEEATFIDFLLGMWAFSSELMRSVEALAAPTSFSADELIIAGESDLESKGSLLR